MLLVIRIGGMVDIDSNIQETLYSLRLRRKYSAVLLKPTPLNLKILRIVRNQISYGLIDPQTLKLLLEKRAVPLKAKKIDAEKLAEELEKKDMKSLDIKPFFRLHPPRGGIESKKHAGVGKGVLGENKKINEYQSIRRAREFFGR